MQGKQLVLRAISLKENLKANADNDKILDHITYNLKAGNDEYIKMGLKASGLAKIFGLIARIPVVGQFIDFKAVSEAFMESFGSGMKSIGTQLVGILKQPVVQFGILLFAFKDLVSQVLKMNETMTKVGNNLGKSAETVQVMYDGFRQTSLEGNKLVGSLDTAFLSVRNMANASLELQDSLETNAMFTNEMIQSQILLTKQMGLSGEEAAGIQKFSLLTGKSAESILQSSIRQNTAAISYRKILKEVSTISAELSMRYGNDPEQIAKAVVQANKLGMTLEETRKISNSLLNFETSIEGELESELLLGKQFNFEKARELALMGKSAEAAGELLGQIGGINALEKMNVIQRERVAAAIGLSADELSKSAREQSILTSLGEQNRKGLEERYELLRRSNDQAGLAKLQQEAANVEGGKGVLQDIARANLNQRFEESMNRIKDIFTEIAAGPITGLLNNMAKLLEHTFLLKTLLVGAATVSAIFAANMIQAAIATAFATGGLSLIPALIGGAALIGTTVALNSSNATPVGDSITSPGGRTISMPKGTLLPDKNDYVYTSTNPLQTGGGGDNIVAAKIDELIGHVKKGGNVYIDSTRSGTAYGMSYNSYA